MRTILLRLVLLISMPLTAHDREDEGAILPDLYRSIPGKDLSDWGWGMEFGLGGTSSQKRIADIVTLNTSYQLKINAYYKRLVMDWGIQGSFGKTPDNNRAYYIGWMTSLGFTICDNRYFRITPFAGLSTNKVKEYTGNYDDESYQYETYVKWKPSLFTGINIELKLNDPVLGSGSLYTTNFRISYLPNVVSKSDILLFTLGININSFKIK